MGSVGSPPIEGSSPPSIPSLSVGSLYPKSSAPPDPIGSLSIPLAPPLGSGDCAPGAPASEVLCSGGSDVSPPAIRSSSIAGLRDSRSASKAVILHPTPFLVSFRITSHTISTIRKLTVSTFYEIIDSLRFNFSTKVILNTITSIFQLFLRTH